MKASDPTGDDEPPEFSDDEEEQVYYKNLRKQQKNSQNWYGPPAYEHNHWPRFPPFPNPAWPPMLYPPPAYGAANSKYS